MSMLWGHGGRSKRRKKNIIQHRAPATGHPSQHHPYSDDIQFNLQYRQPGVYPIVISLLVAVCNKNLLEFRGGVLTVWLYSCICIPPGTLVMSHFKKNVWIPALGRSPLTTWPYISVFSKMDATSPLTFPPWSSKKRDCPAIKLYL